jgi:surfeit locus 1 family protein
MVRGRTIVVGAVVTIVAITCMRLGFWQLSRLAEKKRLNADRRAALAAPPIALGDTIAADTLAGHVVLVHGRYDNARHVLLAGRTHDGEPGVEVHTPLMLPGGIAILVDRGWLGAEVPADAHPERSADPGERAVRGLVEILPRAAGATLRPVAGDSVTVLLGLRLDPDTLAARFPYPVARFTIRELPGPQVGQVPLRTPPEPLDESMHLGYAVQWFAMAAIVAGGSIALALRKRAGAA